MKRLARLSLRLRLTLLFAVLTTAAWGMASVIAWQQTSKKLDKLFDTQQLLFARRLSVMHFDELRAPPASLGEKKKVRHGHIDDDALAQLVAYSWPGNDFELNSIIENIAISSDNGQIGRAHV